MLQIIKYTPVYKLAWNDFLHQAKNAHFMFRRDYMEYHADRFIDHSLLIFEENKLLAILPASQQDKIVISHGGLTFGGFVIKTDIRAPKLLEIFSATLDYLRATDIKKFRYKALPHIYHAYPAEEDLYALFVHQAILIKRDISSSISPNRIGFSGGKKNGIAKAKKEDILVQESDDFPAFFNILNGVLQEKYATKATHTAEEINRLAAAFPQNIKLFGAFKDHQMCAGVIMYVDKMVAHTQYMAVSSQGREMGALDFILHHLINEIYADKPYFDFGISTEKMGKYLNVGLISQKEMFGARGIVYDTYEIDI